MGNSFRRQPGPTLYDEMKTPVTEDVLQTGLLFAFAIIAFSFILIIPGIRGNERVWATIRVFVALWIGAVILVCNFGSWYSDKICTRAQYKAHIHPVGSPQIIQAEIGLSMGLRGMNITLLEKSCGYPVGHVARSYINRNNQDNNDDDYDYYDHRPFPGEQINYNEQFSWANPWGQGRLDFGIFGGRFNQEFRAAKYRGLPYPIMSIAEYFTLDGEQIIWYRRFRVAGWYTHIFMWTAFATYLLSILLFIYVISYGALFMLLTGLLMLLACFTYGITIRNDPVLEIHFPDATLQPSFNYAFWLTLVTGTGTVFLALLIVLVDRRWPRTAAAFFHHSTIIDDILFEGEVEEEETYKNGLEEFGIVSKGSKHSRRGSHGSIRRALPRRNTDTHLVKDDPETAKSDAKGKKDKKHSKVQPPASDKDIQLQEIKIDDTD